MTAAQEPIRIVGVETEKVGHPRNDAGSDLYAVPIKLNRRPSSTWARLLPHVWDMLAPFSTPHRPRIARVAGDTIVLDGTTVEEVRDVHAATLRLVVEEVNTRAAELEAQQRPAQQREDAQRSAHDANVRDVASDIRFD
jgi:hypothetical protein